MSGFVSSQDERREAAVCPSGSVHYKLMPRVFCFREGCCQALFLSSVLNAFYGTHAVYYCISRYLAAFPNTLPLHRPTLHPPPSISNNNNSTPQHCYVICSNLTSEGANQPASFDNKYVLQEVRVQESQRKHLREERLSWRAGVFL